MEPFNNDSIQRPSQASHSVSHWEPRCYKACFEPYQAVSPNSPKRERTRAIKYGPNCACKPRSSSQAYRPRAPRICPTHSKESDCDVAIYSPGCTCSVKLMHSHPTCLKCWEDGDHSGPPTKYGDKCICRPPDASNRRCATGCMSSDGKRAIKYGPDCTCTDSRKHPKEHKPKTQLFPSGDDYFRNRERNSLAKRTARALDRQTKNAPQPLPARNDRRKEYPNKELWKKFEAERKVSLDLMSLIDEKYITEDTTGPIHAATPDRFPKCFWLCPIKASNVRCSFQLELHGLARRTNSHVTAALTEMEYRKSFNTSIEAHLLGHLHSLGFNYDGRGISLARKGSSRALVRYRTLEHHYLVQEPEPRALDIAAILRDPCSPIAVISAGDMTIRQFFTGRKLSEDVVCFDSFTLDEQLLLRRHD